MGKEMVKIVNNKIKHPEERQYLICLRFKHDSGIPESWEIVIGRKAAYESIKEHAEDIDYEHSFILVEQCTLSERKSIYQFMKYAGEFFEDSFDIDDYVKGDWDESDYKRRNDIEINTEYTKDRINMKDFMDNGVDVTELN